MKMLTRNILFLAVVLALPGCMMINAMLGVVSFITTSPLQYAGAAYTVGEYTYEYAVNDKTPDEVIEDKLAWLLGPDDETQPAPSPVQAPAMVAHLADPPITPGLRLPSPAKDMLNRLTLRPGTQSDNHLKTQAIKPIITAQSDPVGKTHTAPPHRVKAVQSNEDNPRHMPSAQAAVPAPKPRHQYIERTSDPLLERLARLEQGLAQAERIALRDADHGVRYSVSSDDAGRTGTGINGSWSIRHSVMQPPPDSVVEVETADSLHVSS